MSTSNLFKNTSLYELQRLIDNIGQKCPPLADRAQRAGMILLAGKCRPIRPDLFEVDGTESRPYTVDLLAETCDCADFQHRAPEYQGSKWCKHLLSALMLAHLARRSVKRENRRLSRIKVYRQRIQRRPFRVVAAA